MPIEVLMPALSPTMEEGTLATWMVKEGDTVNSGDVLAEIETDKATMEVEAVDEGTVARILVEAGSEGVKVNAPIAILLEDGEDASALDGYSAGGGSASHSDAKEQPKETPAVDAGDRSSDQPSSAPVAGASSGNEERIFASPLAKRMAEQAGLDLASITGSGPNGRIVKADVESAQAAPQPSARPTPQPDAKPEPAPATTTEVGLPRGGGAETLTKMGIAPESYRLEPLDGVQKVIARRLTSSNVNVPDFPLTVDCEIDALLAMRKELNGQAPEGIKISVNDMLIRACALSLKAVPESNASYTEDGIAYHHNADVAVAVASEKGLITPIVRQAENKGLSVISSEMKDLAGRARDGKLKPQEYQGGSFSISNLGMFGIREFGSIINEPHGMILSVGAGEPRPVVKDGALAIATMMTVTLTCDHRVVDGAAGARWLQHFKGLIQNPLTMML
ncbi:pyruvate dehydrogenase complex dihydrolipoamide acetyltransferase [Algimonas porphyrae]|uniref:Acetyltransferase component of pyruvate dehydrogenase complex n=1 Tax=Algimonas porphyrae TaxID=1128113 RepID=A0ABQ5UYE3_9PROT|nr:pyruvate dehydrogenase complex dihydrolipoamide acetyltransferase [Algimonas porphyrae]GLQ19385.1 acetyltransferase component of pyruvate dehydrogenase complex [Algimonas porphyrae]